ncbi:MAG: carbohydrate ABC transporter permease [Candidatus Hydrogenedentes bacterium]|nr:carbohydrate ABC transporter permease [Candidatus Hydrogenedentota bacterium]
MPIISKVGRRSLRVRALFALIYTLLIVGSVTMVYPFAVMVAGSFKSQVDVHDYAELVPRYFFDDAMLYRKYVEERYNESIQSLNSHYRTDYVQFEDVDPPAAYSTALVADWRAFLDSDFWLAEFPDTGGRIPISFFQAGSYSSACYKRPELFQIWMRRLIGTFDDDVEAMNRAWGTNYDSFLKAWGVIELWASRRYNPPEGAGIYDDFVAFKHELRRDRPRFLIPLTIDGIFLDAYVFPNNTREIQTYNENHGTQYTSYRQVRLPETVPPAPATMAEWIEYARDDGRLRNLRLTRAGEDAFRAFLLERYGSFEAFAAAYEFRPGSIRKFAIPRPIVSDGGPVVEDFRAFLAGHGNPDDVYLQTVADWERFVRQELHLQNIRLNEAGVAAFREYLRRFYTESASRTPGQTPLEAFARRYTNADVSGYAGLGALLDAFEVPQPVPLGTSLAVDFEAFISTECPASALRLVTLDILWEKYLRRKYGSIEPLNQAVAGSLVYPVGAREENLARLTPLARTVLDIMQERDLQTLTDLFRAIEDDEGLLDRLGQPSLDHVRLALRPEQRSAIGRIIRMDTVAGREYLGFGEVEIQEYGRDWEDLLAERGAIRREHMVSNYRTVLQHILFHGRALFNTAVLVSLMILCALTVNPLAAYALSRFQLPSQYKILLFFMATMAFPAEVTMIPNFLLLKNFPLGYLIQGAILTAVFFGAQQTFGKRHPRVWRGIEGAVVAACVWLVGAAVLRHEAVLAAARLRADSVGTTTLGVLLAGALAILGLGAARSPVSGRFGPFRPVAWFIVVGVLTVFVTPVVARGMGFGSPNVTLLNTFFALVLPVMANGYSIFLLKGFFDSLPQNLYESAQLEGASEMWMFLRITLPLSKPIMAVIALFTFNLAYNTFMYAFIVCQDERMWTIMVFLYELQQTSPQFVVFASIVIASIPTLLVFILAQRVIMRGIIVPVEK